MSWHSRSHFRFYQKTFRRTYPTRSPADFSSYRFHLCYRSTPGPPRETLDASTPHGDRVLEQGRRPCYVNLIYRQTISWTRSRPQPGRSWWSGRAVQNACGRPFRHRNCALCLWWIVTLRSISLGSLTNSARSPPVTSRLCDRLQAAGLLVRRSSANDRREISLQLSRNGRSFVQRFRGARKADLTAVLLQMSPQRRNTLLMGLNAFYSAAMKLGHVDEELV